jgi:hypothetical protein
MMRALRQYWRWGAGLVAAATLAGCAGHYFVQRDPWRKDAELACLKSGAVKETGTVVRIEPINGPGMCGADYPLKVAALGEPTLLGYSEALRPPGDVPGAAARGWRVGPSSVVDDRYASPPSRDGAYANPARPAPVERQPLAPSSGARAPGAPMQIVPMNDRYGAASRDPFAVSRGRETPDDYVRAPPQQPSSARRPSVYDAPSASDDDDDPPLQPQRRAQPAPSPVPQRPASMPVSVPFGRNAVAALGPVEIKPAATLACPIVSALDRWIADAVQPAAQRWFRQPVTEIKQISAYSCRGMNGQPGARISEHAFGNALDIAAFILADGRRITVKTGWRGSPEEQGFLRDVQGAACDQFNTVLAPGSNRFHYDHIHVDLMRRASGHRICNPDSIPGEVVAARVAKERGYAWRPDPGVTGSIGRKAAAGEGARRASLNGKAKPKGKVRNILSADDDDWIEDEGPRPED